jgi:hypothetical protein
MRALKSAMVLASAGAALRTVIGKLRGSAMFAASGLRAALPSDACV